MASLFQENGQGRDTRTEPNTGEDGSYGHMSSAEADQRDRPYWAGVTKGRDGLLGRIESSLGSIS